MNQQTLTISEDLYNRLAADARLSGRSIEQLLDEWEQRDEELKRREKVVREITELRKRMFAKYGMMPDSAELIREDRER